MAKKERCPICDVPVKSENLLRHLDANHPRHPDVAGLKAKLKQEPGRVPKPARAPLRVNKWYAAAAVVAILVVGTGVYGVPVLFPSQGNTFSVDGCINDASVVYHIHPFLKIVINGSPYTIPDDVGNTPSCTHPVHTHQAYGNTPYPDYAELHVESPVAQSYALRDFFHVWGQPFSSSQVLSYVADSTNHISMTVNGASSNAYGNLALQDAQLIVITYGP